MNHLFSLFSADNYYFCNGRFVFNEESTILSRRDFLRLGGNRSFDKVLEEDGVDPLRESFDRITGGKQSRRAMLLRSARTSALTLLATFIPGWVSSKEIQKELEMMSEEAFLNEVSRILEEFVPENKEAIFKVMSSLDNPNLQAVEASVGEFTKDEFEAALVEAGYVSPDSHTEHVGEAGHGAAKRTSFFDDPDAAEGKEWLTFAADAVGAGSFVHAISLWVRQKQIGFPHYIALLSALGAKYAFGNDHKRKHLKEEWSGGASSLGQMFLFASLFKGEFLKDVDWSKYSESQLSFAMGALGHLVAPFNTTFGGSVITAPMLAELTKHWKVRGLTQEEINTKSYNQFVHNPNLAGIFGIGDYPFLKVVQDIGWKKLLPFQFGDPVENGVSDTVMDAWVASLLYQQYQLAPDDLSRSKKLAYALKSFTKKENWAVFQKILKKLVPLRSIPVPIKAAVDLLNPNKTIQDVVVTLKQGTDDGTEFLTPMAEDMKYSFGLAKGIFSGDRKELQRSAVLEMLNPIALNQTMVEYKEIYKVEIDKVEIDLVNMLKDSNFWKILRSKLEANKHVVQAKHDIEKFGDKIKAINAPDTEKVIKAMLSGETKLTDEQWAKIASDLKQSQVSSAASKLGQFLSTEVLKNVKSFKNPGLMFSSLGYFFDPKFAAERLTPFLGMTSAEMVGVLPKQVGAIAAMVDMLSRFEVFVEHLEPVMGKVRARSYYSAVTNYVISSVAENYTGFSVGAELIKKLVGPLLGKDPGKVKLDDPDLKPLFTVFYYISIIGGFSNLLGDFGPHMALITPLVNKDKNMPNIIDSAKANAKNSMGFSAYALVKLEHAIAQVNGVLNDQEINEVERKKMIDEIDRELNKVVSRFLLKGLLKKYEGKPVPDDLNPLLKLLDTTLKLGAINEKTIRQYINPDPKDSETAAKLKRMFEK